MITSTPRQNTHKHMHTHRSTMSTLLLPVLLLLLLLLPLSSSSSSFPPCLSYCGNLTVAFPFSPRPGCGHPTFRDLLFCMNGVLLLHLPSSSFRVLSLDYPFRSLVLHDPSMSTCHHLPPRSSHPKGFVVEPWRAPYLQPSHSNAFLLLGCHADSSLFQGFPWRRAACRNVSGMGCEEFAKCPSWEESGGWGGGEGRVQCCSLPYSALGAVNLTKLGCQGYSGAYTVAPLRSSGASEWSYGIRVSYIVPAEHEDFCRECEATGGACGYDLSTLEQLCMCNGWNSTTNCDSGPISMSRRSAWTPSLASAFSLGLLIYKVTWTFI